MVWLFLALIVIASVALGFIILVQNPKGGGLSGSIAGFSTQFMGVKQTTDVLEKGTWLFAAIIGVLCLFSSLFLGQTSSGGGSIEQVPTNSQQQTPVAPPQQQNQNSGNLPPASNPPANQP